MVVFQGTDNWKDGLTWVFTFQFGCIISTCQCTGAKNQGIKQLMAFTFQCGYISNKRLKMAKMVIA